MLEDVAMFMECQMCGATHRMGPNRYDGQFIAAYKLQVCSACFHGNWDGWSPLFEGKLEAHLKAQGIALPQRNSLGWYPRGM